MDRSVLKRQFLRIIFWAMLTYTSVSSTVVWMMQCGWLSIAERHELSMVDGKSVEPLWSVCSFAEQFTREYLFWTTGKGASREERLKSFLATNMDTQGGLLIDDHVQWDSYVTHAGVWDVKDHRADPQIKEVTVYAETIMTRVGYPTQQKRVDRYMILSIQGVNGTFIIVDNPRFIQAPRAVSVRSSLLNVKKGERISDKEYVEVVDFSKSFLKVYTTGEAQEIRYFLKDTSLCRGLAGVLRFVEMEHVSAYAEPNAVRVECDVVFEDVQSGAPLHNHMRLWLSKEGGQWYVLKIG